MTTNRRSLTSRVALIALLLTVASGVPGRASTDQGRHGWTEIEVNLLKWIATPNFAMAGFVGGDVVGTFSGQVLSGKVSADGLFLLLDAVYEIKAGKRSFTARIKGKQVFATSRAVLEGVVTTGWLSGAAVHVEYDVIGNCGKPDALDDQCYLGNIRLLARHRDLEPGGGR